MNLRLYNTALTVLVLGFLLVPQLTHAANRYWVGGSDGADVNDTANWSSSNPTDCTGGGASVPGSSDIAIFDPDCDNGATIDLDWTVAGININADYAGDIAPSGAETLYVGASDFIMAGGGTFTAPVSIEIEDRINWTAGTFDANGGTIEFSGAGNETLICNSQTFNTITFTHTGGTRTISSDCTFPLGASPSVGSGGNIDLAGTLSGSGTAAFSAALTMSTGATLSGFSDITIGTSLTIAGDDFDASSYSPLVIPQDLIMSSGSFTAPAVLEVQDRINFT